MWDNLTFLNWIKLSVVIILIIFSRSIYQFIQWDIQRDAYAHFLFSKDINQNKHQIPEKPSKAVTSGIYSYPFLLHWILSFIPDRFFGSVDKYFSVMMDLCFSLIILYLGSKNLLTGSQILVSLSLFLCTPQFVRPDLAHGHGLSARKLGLIFTTMSILMFILWLSNSILIYLIMSILFGGCVFLSSKFSLQAYFFISLTISILISPVILVVFATGLILAIVVSYGRYLPVIKGHLLHLYDYAVSKQFKISYTKPELTLFKVDEMKNLQDILEIIYKSNLIFPLVSFPIITVAGIGYFMNQQVGTPLLPGLGAWILGGLAAFVLTSLPYFRFLGEAERYLEYITLPLLVYISSLWNILGREFQIIVYLSMVFGASVILAYYWAYYHIFSADKSDAKAINDVVKFLDNQQPGIVLMQPIWRSRQIAWKTDHKVIDLIMNGASTNESINELECLFPKDYGFVTSDWKWICEKYEPDWVVFDTRNIDEYPSDYLKPFDHDPVFSNSIYSVYKIESDQ